MQRRLLQNGTIFLALAALVGGTGCGSDNNTGGAAATGGSGGGMNADSAAGGSGGAGGSAAMDAKAPDTSGSLKDIVDTAIAAGSFKTLVAAVQAAGLEAALRASGPLTVFAPTDGAFAKLPAGTVDTLLKPENKETLAGILKYHVVAGKVLAADVVKLTKATTLQGGDVKIRVDAGKVFINDAQVIMTDVLASNGVIHVIDAVLTPPAPVAPLKDIVDTAIADPNLGTLVTALGAADLVTTLKGAGPFTVFAPTNAAFQKLPAQTLVNLLNPANKAALRDILLYHVVAGKVAAKDVVTLTKATTALGKDIAIKVDAGKVILNGSSNVTQTDIAASNGIIHVIDTVLIPPQ